ncbi:hypothetical protein CgunFtcFv8_004116 [Champsocephalus gunnari]|uniref:Uncharacterized protein n=1 Tax=Champsocephalus gunnari TaxID=52237 RepID=A0AAN8EA09_CHAGU|nr:hypothetical protein CgunFtcFv8_004116 [Champsocephalus gunnari]
MANTKKPVNGWQVEHAVVLQLAEKESTLKTAERELFKADTPKDNKRSRKPKRLFGDDDEEQDIIPSGDGDCEIPKKKKPTLAAQRRTEEEIITEEKQLAQGTRRPGESSSNEKTQIRELQSQVKTLQKENSRLCNMLVKDAVKNRFPGIKTSDLRKSINTRICELRHQVKRKNKMDN